MTTELEKQFFDTFGIEPKYKTCVFKYCKNKKEYDCENCDDREWHYPQITDKQYLELICMVMNIFDGIQNVYVDYSVEKVKERTLKLLITAKDDVYSQVQAIFEV